MHHFPQMLVSRADFLVGPITVSIRFFHGCHIHNVVLEELWNRHATEPATTETFKGSGTEGVMRQSTISLLYRSLITDGFFQRNRR